MYGRQDYSGISFDELRGTTPEMPLNLFATGNNSGSYRKDVSMLRGIAKLEVADNIENRDAYGYPKVISVALRNYTSNGLLIPLPGSFHNSIYPSTGYNQVFKTSLPDNIKTAAGEKAFARMARYSTGDDGYGNDWDQKFTDGWWTIYIPEMNYGSKGGGAIAPELVITYQRSRSNATETKRVNLPEFQTSEGMLLRNHIYRIEVGMTLETQISLRYGICPWVNETINIPPFN